MLVFVPVKIARSDFHRMLCNPTHKQGHTMDTQQAKATAALISTAAAILAEKKSKLSQLKVRRAEILAQIQQIEARENVKKRKQDARRLILIGRCVQEWARRDLQFNLNLRDQLERFATRPRDREILNLSIGGHRHG